MNRKEEKEYFALLEKIIREQKSKSHFWDKNSNSYEMDILMLAEHIRKKKPELLDKIIGNLIDGTKITNSSKKDILSFMAHTEKGTVCRWKNEKGEEVFLINNGENFLKKTKQILVIGNRVNKGDLELLKKSMYGTVLKKDIQKIYEKIAAEEKKKQQGTFKKTTIFSEFEKAKEKIERHSASDFERNFKTLVREQGPLCIPMGTAQTMLAFMPETEKNKLASGLNGMGVKDSVSFEHLLDQWKNEALNPEYEFERKRKKTSKKINIEITRSL